MVAALGRFTLESFEAAREMAGLCGEAALKLFTGILTLKIRGRECLEQMYRVGAESAPIVILCLAVVSLMSILEFSFHIRLVIGTDSLVPAFSTVMMVRELAPVVSSMLLASRVGAGIAAELGSMKVTDQLDQLELLSVCRIEYLVIPRLVGCVFAALSLTVCSLAVAILVGAFFGARALGHSAQEFMNSIFLFTHFRDLYCALIKAFVFGSVIAFASSFQGFRCGEGAEGVGTAATRAVVQSSLLIILLDFVLTYALWTL